MYQFFVEPAQINIPDKRVIITGADVNHIRNVLRMKPGEELSVRGGQDGREYRCGILSLGETIVCELRFIKEDNVELPARIYLFQGLPKGDKMELIIQKAVELGAEEITPVLTRRCVSRPDKSSMEKKLLRYQKISEEAAKQSGRGRIPRVSPLLSFEEAVKELSALPLSLLFYEKGGEPLSGLLSRPASCIGLMVGAEGGFDPEEVRLAAGAGLRTATLGPRILRCETAPLCALSVILYATGNL